MAKEILVVDDEFDELNNDDVTLPLSECSGTTVVLAMRSWQYGLFESLRK